jgi:predicted acyltransferase
MQEQYKRFFSLDVLRGLTVAGMILVNNPGCSGECFSWLRHAAWHGCVVADLVYPFFLFVVGASCWFSMRKTGHQLNAGVVWRILKRGICIFGLGLVYNWLPFDFSISHLRIMGVLQRIALVYVVGSFLALGLKSYLRISLASLVILCGYWLLLSTTGFNDPWNNLPGQVDLALFGQDHIHVYNARTGTGFDPEGIPATLPALVNMLLGYMAAMWLGQAENKPKAALRLMGMAAGVLVIAWLWNFVFPYNKQLWTSSFVLYTCGWAALLWSVLLYVIDFWKIKGWTVFFAVFGTNALFTYFLSGVLAVVLWRWQWMTVGGERITLCGWLTEHVFSIFAMPSLSGLLWGMCMLLFCWAVTYPLYRKKIFIKL